jgi:hypothetical protein
MRRDFTRRRRAILGVVILLVLADVALAAYSWQLASTPHTPQQLLALEMRQHDLLRADIKRAQEIRDKMPAIQKDCDQFERSLFPATTGYSSVTAELGDTANKAGIHLADLTFKQTDIANRGLKEVLMDATVSGDYKHVIQFLNGMQRSKNLYEVDGLSLASETSTQTPTGVIKVTLHLKTYFRATS